MNLGNTPGITGFTKSGTTIALHQVCNSIDVENDVIKTSHQLSVYSIMNEFGQLNLTVNANFSKQSLEILHESIGDYLKMLEEHDAMTEMNEDLKDE